MAAANPNTARITDAMWWLWLACHGLIPGVRLGGIYADKSGFHNTVNANLARWPGNYSVRYAIDRRDPKTKARAIDLTMNSTWMRTITRRLLDGAARRDRRMRCMKEFYGTVDGKHVVGRIKDGPDEPWRTESSDTSHLWHVHGGLHTPFVDDMEAMEGLLSLLSGEDWDAWMARKYGGQLPGLPVSGVPAPVLREGASGAGVLALQVYLNGVISAGLIEDGDFGPATTLAVRELQRRAGITIDGVYGDDSADALRNLLEDDMSWKEKIPLFTGKGVAYEGTEWPASSVLASAHYYILLHGQKIAAEQDAARRRDEAILAKLAGADTKTILDAINKRATEDAARDAALMAEATAAVRAGLPSVEELAAAVAAAVDHELDVDAAAEALRQVLRTGVGE